MKNYFLQHFENYISEILAIEGKLIVTETCMQEYMKQMKKSKLSYNDLVTALTSFRDLSIRDRSKANLLTSSFSYQLTLDEIENDVSDIISQQSCLSVSQAYEVFETYLIEIITEFLYQKQQHLKTIKLYIDDTVLIREDIRKMVKSARDNKSRIKWVQKLSAHFRDYERKNYFDVDIIKWFDLVTMVRHVLVHNRQIINVNFLNYLEDTKSKDIFDSQFKRKKINNNVCIYLEKNPASDVIHWLSSFAHLIFKSLSIELGMPLEIPRYIPPLSNFYNDNL